MKTFKKFLAVMMAALIVLALSSCDLIEDAEITPATNGVEAGDIRIGILYSSDYEKEDTAAHVQHKALETMMGTYSIAGTIPKNKIDVTNTQKIEDSIISCVKESGCNVVLSTDPAFTSIMYKFAANEDYKDIIFTCLDSTDEYESTANFNCFYPDYQDAYALAGIAAASTQQVNNIALTEDNDAYLAAFAMGAKAVNPSAKVISGEKIETYGEIVTNWHIYYITLVENLTLNKFEEMGNYNAGVETGFCNFAPSADYTSDNTEAQMSAARLAINEGKWDFANEKTIKF